MSSKINVTKLNIKTRKSISADDKEYLTVGENSLIKNPLTIIGADISIPMQRLKVISTEFERDAFFPDAIALVEVVEGGYFSSGDHLSTPWGIVKIN